MLSYFGTDQSQVQRYLSGKSINEMRLGLIFNGIVKVPMQFFILLVGVMVFVFYQFNASPLNFNPEATKAVLNSSYSEEYNNLQIEQDKIFQVKRKLINKFINHKDETIAQSIALENEADKENREAAKEIIEKASEETGIKIESNDKDYVFIHFILNNLPRGLIGLLLAVILSAAMSSTASELNALASTTTIDLYKRNLNGTRDEKHYVNATKWFTLGWGILAIGIACIANLAENLIQLVNIIGSIFYGNVLGIFLLAFFFKSVKSKAVFSAAIITQIIIIGLFLLNEYDYINLPFLWLNFVGCSIVIFIALLMSYKSLDKKDKFTLFLLTAILSFFLFNII